MRISSAFPWGLGDIWGLGLPRETCRPFLELHTDGRSVRKWIPQAVAADGNLPGALLDEDAARYTVSALFNRWSSMRGMPMTEPVPSAPTRRSA